MIEDDLRELLSDAFDIGVYSRLIPTEMPECIVVQEIGGRASRASIRRAYRLISVMAVSKDAQQAQEWMLRARDYLTTHIPVTIGSTHYYRATPQANGDLLMKSLNGPKYVHYCDIEVVVSI